MKYVRKRKTNIIYEHIYMESRKIVLGNLLVGRNRGKDIEDRLADIAGKGVGGTNQEPFSPMLGHGADPGPV